mgnify:CR=1 FL=1
MNSSMTSSVIMIVAMFALMYFLMIRPEKKRKQQAENMRNALKKGDSIVTIGGIMGKVFVSTGCKRDYTMRTVIYGTKGTLICDNTSPTMTLFTTDEEGVTLPAQTIEIEVNNHNAAKEFEVFADAIINGKDILTDAREGAKTVEVCRSIVEASVSGKIVKPNYNF